MEQQQQDISGLRSVELANGSLTLVLNNTLAAIEEGRQEILEFIGPIDAMALNRLEIIFEELVSNTVRHGFSNKSAQSIHVRIKRDADAIHLTMEDDGVPFNPVMATLPERARNIETARIGGMGIPLAIKLSNALKYEELPPTNASGFCPRNRIKVSVVL